MADPNALVLSCDLKRGIVTLRPETPDGDDYFGLSWGTNGTAAASRRRLAEPTLSAARDWGLSLSVDRLTIRWVRFSGAPATGLNTIPTNRSDVTFSNPWGS